MLDDWHYRHPSGPDCELFRQIESDYSMDCKTQLPLLFQADSHQINPAHTAAMAFSKL